MARVRSGGRAGMGRHVYTGRNVKVFFALDYAGIAKCAVGKELRGECHDIVVNRALPFALSISPRSNIDHQHFADSWVVEDVLTGLTPPESIGKPPMLRVGTRLINAVAHAVYVEWGNEHSDGHRVLTKTLNHLSRQSTAG